MSAAAVASKANAKEATDAAGCQIYRSEEATSRQFIQRAETHPTSHQECRYSYDSSPIGCCPKMRPTIHPRPRKESQVIVPDQKLV